MKRNSLQHLALLAADLPETDLDDLLEFAEALHRQNRRKCVCSGVALKTVLSDIDLRFCRIEALANLIDHLSLDSDRLTMGAAMMLSEEVQTVRTMIDEIGI